MDYSWYKAAFPLQKPVFRENEHCSLIQRLRPISYASFGLNRRNLKNWPLITKIGFAIKKNRLSAQIKLVFELSALEIYRKPILAQIGATSKIGRLRRKPVSKPDEPVSGRTNPQIRTQHIRLCPTPSLTRIGGKKSFSLKLKVKGQIPCKVDTVRDLRDRKSSRFGVLRTSEKDPGHSWILKFYGLLESALDAQQHIRKSGLGSKGVRSYGHEHTWKTPVSAESAKNRVRADGYISAMERNFFKRSKVANRGLLRAH
jgi:hypothetical protein